MANIQDPEKPGGALLKKPNQYPKPQKRLKNQRVVLCKTNQIQHAV